MDPITHAISGAVLARTVPKTPIPPRQVWLLILLAMAPDSDILLRLFSDPVYLQHHRGLTHSLLMLPLWVWLIFSFSSRRIKKEPAMPLLIALALLLHIGLDLITTFGTMVFAPLTDQRISFDLVFIIDPLFSACLLIPLLSGLIWKPYARTLGVFAFTLAFSYLALTWHNQQQGVDLARKTYPDAMAYHALPMAFSPYNWQLIVEYPDEYIRTAVNLKPEFAGLRPLFSNRFATSLLSTSISDANHLSWQTLPAMHTLEGMEQLPGTAFYSWFARYPVIIRQEHDFIDLGDLAFGAGAPGVRSSFRLHIDLSDKPGNDGQPPRTWLIWRGDHQSELTQHFAPFRWLPSN